MANELGDYLPNDDESLEAESERIAAFNQPHADAKCKKLAKEYGGFESNAVPIGKRWFDCKFKIWRKSSND